MKHFFTLSIIVFLAGIVRVSAQPILTAANNQPQAGDITSSQYAYTTGVMLGATGASKTWDYSGLTDSAATASTQFVLPSATPYAATFPTANLAGKVVDTGTTVYLYFNATASSTPVLGFQLDTIVSKYRNPLSTQNYPFTYPDSFNDSSTIYIISANNVINAKVWQLDTATATGYGTLKLPGGISYNNVLQVKLSISTIIRTFITGFGEISLPPYNIVTYNYYTPGYHGLLLSYTLSSDGSSVRNINYARSVVLPLRFISFTAVSNKQGVALKWETGDELNTGHFNVQHSADGTNFTNIGELNAGGSGAHDYNFTDIRPSQGDNFYRIQAVDIDGRTTNSTIVPVQFNNLAANNFYLVSNPVRNSLRVHIGGSSPNSMLIIFDMSGKLVKRTPVTNDGIQRIDVSALSKGIYTIQYISATKNVSKKFVKE